MSSTYVSIPNTGIPGLNWTNLFTYNVSLNNGGGSWFIGANKDFSSQGSPISIFGLNGICTAYGKRYDATMKGPAGSGVFGSGNIHKQLDLLISNPYFYIANASYSAGSGITPISNCASMASYIGSQAGISVIWGTRNVPLNTLTFSPTMTVLDALNALANLAGGVVRWNGGNSYYVGDPNTTTGSFIVPDQRLIAIGGCEGYSLYDLETSNSTAPALLYSNISVGQVVTSAPQYPTINKLFSITKLLTIDDPTIPFDLPPNFNNVYVQIILNTNAQSQLVGVDGATVSGILPDGRTNYTGGAFISTDPNQWACIGSAGQSSYVTRVLKGNTYVPQFNADYTLFPSGVPAIESGYFTMNIGVTYMPLESNSSYSLAVTPVTYTKSYQGSIHCVFYGVMPLPGMYAQASLDDLTVSGVVESVTFSPPGYLSIEVAQYLQVNWEQPLASVSTSH